MAHKKSENDSSRERRERCRQLHVVLARESEDKVGIANRGCGKLRATEDGKKEGSKLRMYQ
jgi:hypothetical protein